MAGDKHIFKNLFTVYSGDRGKGDGSSYTCTNKRSLADYTGISYNSLVFIFTRKRLRYWESPGGDVIIRSDILIRGKARNRGSEF